MERVYLRSTPLSSIILPLVRYKDTTLGLHSHRVGLLAQGLYIVLKESPDSYESLGIDKFLAYNKDTIYLAGYMHDIGKMHMDYDILTKSGKLTQTEYEIVKLHPLKGVEHFSSVYNAKCDVSVLIHDAIKYHHERWDGKGYPIGLNGVDIPIIGRILNIVDSFDVMVYGRIYSQIKSVDMALKELQRCAGTQFDPYLVDIFLKNVDVVCNKVY